MQDPVRLMMQMDASVAWGDQRILFDLAKGIQLPDGAMQDPSIPWSDRMLWMAIIPCMSPSQAQTDLILCNPIVQMHSLLDISHPGNATSLPQGHLALTCPDDMWAWIGAHPSDPARISNMFRKASAHGVDEIMRHGSSDARVIVSFMKDMAMCHRSQHPTGSSDAWMYRGPWSEIEYDVRPSLQRSHARVHALMQRCLPACRDAYDRWGIDGVIRDYAGIGSSQPPHGMGSWEIARMFRQQYMEDGISTWDAMKPLDTMAIGMSAMMGSDRMPSSMEEITRDASSCLIQKDLLDRWRVMSTSERQAILPIMVDWAISGSSRRDAMDLHHPMYRTIIGIDADRMMLSLPARVFVQRVIREDPSLLATSMMHAGSSWSMRRVRNGLEAARHTDCYDAVVSSMHAIPSHAFHALMGPVTGAISPSHRIQGFHADWLHASWTQGHIDDASYARILTRIIGSGHAQAVRVVMDAWLPPRTQSVMKRVRLTRSGHRYNACRQQAWYDMISAVDVRFRDAWMQGLHDFMTGPLGVMPAGHDPLPWCKALQVLDDVKTRIDTTRLVDLHRA
jgi:hypothetical protein